MAVHACLSAHIFGVDGHRAYTRIPWHRSILHEHIILDIEVVEPEHHPVQVETVIETVPDICRARLGCSGHCKTTLLLDRDVLSSLTALHGHHR
ncbi:hypothetical protein N183_26415 [Sinorhizobium sp. Sb3]|nr:hypothetical protein N183_26415 [Sinorhizobium sp. Sb3]